MFPGPHGPAPRKKERRGIATRNSDPILRGMESKISKFFDQVDPIGLFFVVGLALSVVAVVLNILGV